MLSALGNTSLLQSPMDSPTCRAYKFAVMGCVSGTVCVLGVAGNVLSVLIFTRSSGAVCAAACLFLKALAVADLLYLVTYCLSVVWVVLADYYLQGDINQLKVTPYFSMYIFPLSSACLAASKYYTVLVTFHRYLAVCSPFKVALLTNTRVPTTMVTTIGLVSFIFMIPKFFEVKITHHTNMMNETYPVLEQSDLWYNSSYQLVYKKILGVVILNAIPLLSVSVMTTLIIRTLILDRRNRENTEVFTVSSVSVMSSPRVQRRNTPGQSRQREQDTSAGQQHPHQYHSVYNIDNLSIPLIIIALIYLLCHIMSVFYPLCYLCQGVCVGVKQDDLINCPCPCYFVSIASDTLTVINSAINFLIYYPTTASFRRQFLRICLCRKSRIGPLIQPQ